MNWCRELPTKQTLGQAAPSISPEQLCGSHPDVPWVCTSDFPKGQPGKDFSIPTEVWRAPCTSKSILILGEAFAKLLGWSNLISHEYSMRHWSLIFFHHGNGRWVTSIFKTPKAWVVSSNRSKDAPWERSWTLHTPSRSELAVHYKEYQARL